MAVDERVAVAEATAEAAAELRGRMARAGLRDVPEGLPERCLAAASNDVDVAYAQARDIVRWRKQTGADHILENPRAIAAEHWYRRLLHYSLTGRDRRGRAVMIEAVGQWDMEELDKAARENRDKMIQAHVVVCETLLKQAQEAASADSLGGWPHDPALPRRAPGFVAVLDMKGISFRQNPLAYPHVLRALREISKINARYYPEAVEHVFVVNAPRLFQSIWRALSPFVLPSSGVRVDVLPHGDFGALVRECGAACLPHQLGGSLPADSPPYQASADLA